MEESEKPLPGLKKRALTPKQLPKHKLGKLGEDKARLFLTQKGYKLIGQNLRLGRFELDCVCIDRSPTPACLVIVEVKTRSSIFFGDPSLSVGFRKQRHLRRAAAQLARQLHWTGDIRIDVVTVIDEEIQHYKNITWP